MAGNAACRLDLPKLSGKWTGVYVRFRRRSQVGMWDALFRALTDTPGFEPVPINSTVSEVHAEAMGARAELNLPPSVGRRAVRPPDCTASAASSPTPLTMRTVRSRS